MDSQRYNKQPAIIGEKQFKQSSKFISLKTLITIRDQFRRMARAQVAVLGILIVILGVLSTDTSTPNSWLILKRLDLLLYDLRFRLMPRPEPKHSPNIVIVDIDEQSLQAIERWPWRRQTLANLMVSLKDQGALLVGLDIVFPERENNIVEQVLSEADIPPHLQDILLNQKHRFAGDQALSSSVSELESVTGFILHTAEKTRLGHLPTGTQIGNDQQNLLVNMPGYSANFSELQQQALGGGFLSVFPDTDGVIRKAPLILRHGDKLFSSLGVEMITQFLLIDPPKPIFGGSDQSAVLEGIEFNDRFIATDPTGQVLVPFFGNTGKFTYYSASDIMLNKLPADSLEGSLVLIGTSALGLADLKTTPFGTGFPGVETHATIMEALLHFPIPATPDWEHGATLLLIIIVGSVLSIILPFLSAIRMAFTWLITVLSLIGINFWLWHTQYIAFPLASLLFVLFAVGLINLAFGFMRETSNRRQMQDMFGQYVAPDHIKRLLSDNTAESSFSGETKHMTVLFSDIRGFTKLSESLSATDLKNLLNRFFTPMTEIIFTQNGTIDKYVGDMIMAFWGAPLDDDNQEFHAVTAALLMQEKVIEVNKVFATEGLPKIGIGIGINSGPMNVGDMGSQYRRAYTVLGDSVNLGSRLESITKFYGVGILVSESTMNKVDNVLFRCIDHIIVVGKEEPIKIYEPRCFNDSASQEDIQLEQNYQQAREAYLQKEWHHAQQLFLALKEHEPSCKLHDIYLQRIEKYRNGVEENWCGIFRHTSK